MPTDIPLTKVDPKMAVGDLFSITPKQWVEANRQWKRIDNIDHAKYQLGRPTSDKIFWNSVLELLGAPMFPYNEALMHKVADYRINALSKSK
jgi:hypothetical protein